MKIYLLTIAYNEETEEVEYIEEEIMDETEDRPVSEYGVMELGDWISDQSDDMITILKDIAEA